jgi:hypothetical protein
MKARVFILAIVAIVGPSVSSVSAGDIYNINYTDLASGTTTDLTTAGTLDWVKWSNGESGTSYTTPVKVGGDGIGPDLTALGSVPSGQTVVLRPFPATAGSLAFNWTDGTAPMAGGGPVISGVTETISPAQNSYPLGLGLSFQAAASATPELLNLYVFGFNARTNVTASLSGGGTDSLLASSAALNKINDGPGATNYYSFGVFSIEYSGAGETLTVDLTAANQSGIPTDATQYVFRNAGAFAATLSGASVPEPSSLVLSITGLVGVVGYGSLRRAAKRKNRVA